MSYMPDPHLITFCVQPRDVGSYATCAATSHKMLNEIKRLNTNILAALGQLHRDPGDDPDPSSLLPVAAAGAYAEVERLRTELVVVGLNSTGWEEEYRLISLVVTRLRDQHFADQKRIDLNCVEIGQLRAELDAARAELDRLSDVVCDLDRDSIRRVLEPTCPSE